MNTPIFTVFLVTTIYLLSFINFSLFSGVDLHAQQRGNISVIQATALPLVNSEGNQVKLIINYSIEDESNSRTQNKYSDGNLQSRKW